MKVIFFLINFQVRYNEDDGIPQDVIREIAMLKAISHPNIIRYSF